MCVECRRLGRIFLQGFCSGGLRLNSATVVLWALYCFGCVDDILTLVIGVEDVCGIAGCVLLVYGGLGKVFEPRTEFACLTYTLCAEI
jgi:hypothetical protein